MNEDQVNEARANDAIEKLVAARGEMARTVSQMSLKLRVVLTPQQWQELRGRIGQRGQAAAPANEARPGSDEKAGRASRPGPVRGRSLAG